MDNQVFLKAAAAAAVGSPYAQDFGYYSSVLQNQNSAETIAEFSENNLFNYHEKDNINIEEDSR